MKKEYKSNYIVPSDDSEVLEVSVEESESGSAVTNSMVRIK